MNKLFVFILVIFTTNAVFGQNQSSLWNKLDIEFDIGVGFYSGEHNSKPYPTIDTGDDYVNSRPAFDGLPEPSYMGMIRINWALNENLNISSGIGYTIFNSQFNATNRSLYSSYENGTAWSTNYLGLYPRDLRYLTVPIGVVYQFHRFQIEAALENRFLIGATGKRLLESKGWRQNLIQVNDADFLAEQTGFIETYGMKKVHFQVQLGMKYFFTDLFGLKLQYVKTITSMSKDATEIPTGVPLFTNDSSKPAGFSIHFIAKLAKKFEQ